MTDLISDEAVALSLMREPLTFLDEPSNTDAATLLGQAIDAVERLISGEQGAAPATRRGAVATCVEIAWAATLLHGSAGRVV